MPTTELFLEIVRRRLSGEDVVHLAAAFHATLAEMIAAGCRAARDKTSVSVVALSGGVFQNTVLLGLVEQNLRRDGFYVLRHRLIPANDGGISLGQAVCAAARILEEKSMEA